MKNFFLNNALFRFLAPPVYGIIVYLLILLINNSINTLEENFFTQEVYISIILTYLIFEVNRFVIILIEKYYSREEKLSTRILIQLVINSIITIAIVSGVVAVYFIYFVGFSNFSTELTYLNIIFLVTSLMYNMVYFSNIYLHLQNKERLEEESQLKELVEGEFYSFKNDINPGLLYESLEMLISIIHKNPVDAEDYIDRLSYAYRYILSNKQNELVSLEQDLKAGKNLVNLLNVKYEENIIFENNISSEEEQRQIIPGTIPGIIEYIVRMNIINKNQPLKIDCSVEADGYLVFEYNTNERLEAEKYDTGIISRLQKAYSYYSDEPVVKIDAYGENYIKIPAMELSREELVI